MRKLTRTFHKIFSPSGKGLGEKGFTLIELLVVVAILGAIAAVVVLNVGGFIGRGECEGYCTEKHNVQTAAIAADAEGKDCQKAWTDYIIGDTKYDWGKSVDENCKVTDAANPPKGCDCLDTD